jgi:hypothetical protein
MGAGMAASLAPPVKLGGNVVGHVTDQAGTALLPLEADGESPDFVAVSAVLRPPLELRKAAS